MSRSLDPAQLPCTNDDSRATAACPGSDRLAEQPALSAVEPDLAVLTLATLGYVLIFPSTLAYLFFNRGIALIGPNRAAPFFHLVPVFGSAMAIVLLGEQPRLFHLVGYLLVLAGAVIASRRASAAR